MIAVTVHGLGLLWRTEGEGAFTSTGAGCGVPATMSRALVTLPLCAQFAGVLTIIVHQALGTAFLRCLAFPVVADAACLVQAMRVPLTSSPTRRAALATDATGAVDGGRGATFVACAASCSAFLPLHTLVVWRALHAACVHPTVTVLVTISTTGRCAFALLR